MKFSLKFERWQKRWQRINNSRKMEYISMKVQMLCPVPVRTDNIKCNN